MKKLWITLVCSVMVILATGCGEIGTENPPSPLPKSSVVQNEEVKKEDTNIKVETNSTKQTISAKVIRVVDGDTILADVNGKEEKVRFLLVDTPETKHPNKPVQPFGPEASDFTKKTLTGKTVELEFDVQERDQYGRLLAYVWLNDVLINEQLLQKGFARVVVYQPNVKYVDDFRDIQRKAQEDERGIWSIENYVTNKGYNTDTVNTPSTSKEQSNSSTPSTGCLTIKGNISSSGEKIYHMKDQQYYDRTNPEETFCTEQEAKEAGYRKSMR